MSSERQPNLEQPGMEMGHEMPVAKFDNPFKTETQTRILDELKKLVGSEEE